MTAKKKQHIEFEDEAPKSRKFSYKGPKIKELFVDGSVLTRKNVVAQLPYILFLTLLAVFYIGNRYNAEKVIRRTAVIEQSMKDLRSEYITTAAQLMNISKQSKVVDLVNKHNLGLKESVEPPIKIVVDKKELED